MSSDTDLIRGEIWESLSLSKENREAFVSAHLSSNIGAQIFALRETRGWSQGRLAAEVGMAQPRISILEGGYDNYSLRTLKRLASAFDVAVVVRFVPFSELVNWVSSLAQARLAPVSFINDSLTEQFIGTSDVLLAANMGGTTTIGSVFGSGTLVASRAPASTTYYPIETAEAMWQTTNIAGTINGSTLDQGVNAWNGGFSNAGEIFNFQGYFPIPTQAQTFIISGLEKAYV